MQITDDDIRRFQDIWRTEFAEEITTDEARGHIARLDALYLLLARPSARKADEKSSVSEEPQHQ